VTVHLVGAGPGDPGLITLRGAALLAAADVVAYDRLVSNELLALAAESAELIDVGKRPGRPRSQEEISALLVELSRKYATVVRLKGGDPFLFGRGGEEVEVLLAAGVEVEVVPGVTSAFAAPAFGGIPVTHRGLSSSVTVVTGHIGDRSALGGVDWESLARAGGTIVILMGVANRAEIASRLVAGGRPMSEPVAVVEGATTRNQRVKRSTLERLAHMQIDSPATIVVGPVAGLDLDWVASRPLAGWEVVVTRPEGFAAVLETALRNQGASVVTLPTIAVVDADDGGLALEEAIRSLGTYDWAAFTSANAARRFMARVPDSRVLAGVRVAAVGPATAEVLASGHVVADLVAAKASAAGLVESMGTPEDANRVVFFRAADASATLASGLRSAGWDVDEVETYKTLVGGPEVGAEAGAVERAARADAVVFASPSAVHGFVSLMAGRKLPAVAVCIGPSTASAADAVGFEEIELADDASDAGLVAAVIASRSMTPTGGGSGLHPA
jgi:uroporphyrinogen III methyltransferase / synthase